MPSNVYCPFCGIIMLSDYHSDALVSPQNSPRPWYEEVRGIYPANSLCSIGLTGLGILRRRNTLHAPLESHRSYFGLDIDALDAWKVCDTSEGRWCFAFHNSCWELLLLRPGNGTIQNEMAIVNSVFNQLYCTPCFENSSFQFGHDYQGAAQTQRSFGRPQTIDSSSHFYADPCAIPSATDLEAILSDDSNSKTVVSLRSDDDACASALFESSEVPAIFRSLEHTAEGIRTKEPSSDLCVFDKLSTELSSEIFSYLSFHELLSLRLICRRLALFAANTALAQSYWRSRFCIGQEADFLFPRLTEPRNWARLFMGTKVSLRNNALSLVNRKRVRRLLEPIAALIDLEAGLRSGPYGCVFCPAQNKDDGFQCLDSTGPEKSPSFLQISRSFSGQLPSLPHEGPLEEGCRALYYRAQSLMPPPQQSELWIGISTIQVGVQTFISGINLFPASRIIGYHIPASEKWINIPSTDLRAVHVAFCSEGLTGIKFVFEDLNSSDWVGDTSSPGIAFGTLTIQEGPDWPYLLAGLDYFKIVSPGVSKVPNHLSDDVASPDIHSSLWAPYPPTDKNLEFSPMLPSSRPSRIFEPLMNIDFGGPRGPLLKGFTRLIFYMTSRPSPLIGIEVLHSDRNSLLCDTRSGCELSFFISGLEGERIDRVGVFEESSAYDPEITLGGLQVSTNSERTASFARLRSRPNDSVRLLPVLPHHSITGFIATREGLQNRFTRIGTKSQPIDERPERSAREGALDHERHQVPDHQLRYDEKFAYFIDGARPDNYQTYASLINARKIQASTGINGRSRSPACISGLKIDYFDHPTPAVLGQWMEEIDEAFELSPGEKFQALSIWLTPVGFSSESRGLELGQVTAIHIETSHSRSVTFRSSHNESTPHHEKRLLDQFQSHSGEELVAISWILNPSYDRVRAVSSYTDVSRRAQIVVPELPPPFDQIQRLYFTTPSRDGYRETAIAIKAFFQNQAIVGIAFVYPSDRLVRVGESDAVLHQTIDLPQHSRVVGFSVAGAEREIRGLEFELESNGQSAPRRLNLPMSSSHDSAHTISVECDWRSVWCKDAMSAESHQPLFAHDRIYAPPSKSRLVGVSVGCQSMSRVGALYEPEGSC